MHAGRADPTAVRVHENEVEVDAALVGRLIGTQFPQWAGLAVTRVEPEGATNVMFRLEDDMAVRLPRIDWAVAGVAKEQRWLRRLGPLLPLSISAPLAQGEPGEGYPWPWSVYRWLEGDVATIDSIVDPRQAAVDLAHFITALQRIDPTGG